MKFEKGYIYHIYNQGNNRQKIFFNHENYLYFLRKIKTYITPYTDIMAWCLMPNHFHLMVSVRELSLASASQGFTHSETLTPSPKGKKERTLNDSIGIMLRTYTRAINKQNKTTGSLFRKETKAECVNCFKGVTPSYYLENEVTKINITHPEKQYPQVLFNYIHNNPVKAGLVKKIPDWEFSSARDYVTIKDGSLINKEVIKKYL